jgi:hypothetical protein
MERVAAIAGVFDGADLTFADVAASAAVQTGDVLLLVAYGSDVGPLGDPWSQRFSGGDWQAWTRSAVALEAFPTLPATDGANDPAGVLLIYRHASESYAFGSAAAVSTAAVTDHETAAATVVDTNGLLLGLWLGAPAASEPDATDDAYEELVRQETSDASGGGVRWFVVVAQGLNAAPSPDALRLTTPANQSMQVAIVALRDRPPAAPRGLVDAGAGAHIGLLPDVDPADAVGRLPGAGGTGMGS